MMKLLNGWYYSVSEIENDFIYLIANTIEKRAVNDIAKFYLTEVLNRVWIYLSNPDLKFKYWQFQWDDMNYIHMQNKFLRVGYKWYKKAPPAWAY